MPYFVPRWAYLWEDIFSRARDPRSRQDGAMRGRREVFLGMDTSAATGAPLIFSKLQLGVHPAGQLNECFPGSCPCGQLCLHCFCNAF